MKKLLSLLLILAILLCSIAAISFNTQAAESYMWPVPASTKINQYYSGSHDGLDIGGSLNTPVVATMSGTVVAVIHGDVAGKWIGYGNGVVIQHSNGYYSHYAHMNSTSVSNGQYVSQGQEVGKMGSTGNSTGVHLHFAIATSMYGAGGRINNNPGTIGYIYSPPTAASFFTSVWSSDVSETDAKINATINGTNISTCGFYIGKSQSNMEKRTETVNGYVENIWYVMSADYGSLSKGTTYYYKFFIVVNGVEYCSDINTFKTSGCNHSYTSKVTTAPTCTKNGIRTYTCSYSCGSTYTETIAKTGHSEVIDKAISATCSETGLTEGKHCSVCGTVIVAQNKTDIIKHTDYDSDNKCDICDTKLKDEPSDSEKVTCDCMCHKTGLSKIIYMIIRIFWKLLGSNKICSCGISHY